MATTRIYVVTDSVESATRLIEATSQAAAVAQVVHERYSAKAATPKEVAAYYQTGAAGNGKRMATDQEQQPNAQTVQ